MKVASKINADWIDVEVQFPWTFPGSDVQCEVWGVVRAVHHDSEATTVWLSRKGREGDDRTGFTIPVDTVVSCYAS